MFLLYCYIEIFVTNIVVNNNNHNNNTKFIALGLQ